MKRSRLFRFAVFFVIIAAYSAVRLRGMTGACLWFDEIFSVHAAEHSWDSILSFISLDLIHPPLFYVLLKLWIGIGGNGLFWLRLFPVIFSVLAIFPFIALCRELKLSFGTQLLALCLFASNGILIKYAQEVRMYSVLLCLSLFSTWLFTRYFIKGKSIVPLIIVNILLVYVHYFGWLVLAAEVGSVLLFQRIKWRPILIMFSLSLLSFLPWAVEVFHASKSGTGLTQNVGWIERPGILAIFQLAVGLVEPFYHQTSSVESLSNFRISLPLLATFFGCSVLFLISRRRIDSGNQATVKILAAFTLLPIIIVFVCSWLLPYSIWGARHLIIIFAPLTILFAMTVVQIEARAIRITAITMVAVITGYGFVLANSEPASSNSWCGCEAMAATAARMGQGNIYTFEDLVAYHVWYGSRADVAGVNVFKVSGIEGLTEDRSYFLPRGFDDIKTVDFEQITDPQLFIVFRAKQIDEREPPVRTFLVPGYHIRDKFVVEGKDGNAMLLYLEKSSPQP